jgi:triphosphatase
MGIQPIYINRDNMNTEIELKFLVMQGYCVEQIEKKLTETLIAKKYHFTCDKKKLINGYFDTPDLVLRHHDMGLRVRSSFSYTSDNDAISNQPQIEQTIKTAGQVIGGLHQRPEYNVTIEKNCPQLSLFPEKIWQEQQKVDVIQANLINIFSTNFIRLIWLVTMINKKGEETLIELVFDQGKVSTESRSENIAEIELELITGKVEDLFVLAKALSFSLPIRPGIKSKAARGYALWHAPKEQVKAPYAHLPTLALVPLKSPQQLNDLFTAGLEFGLNQLQTTVDKYIEESLLAYLPKITESLALLRQGFWLFEAYLSTENLKLRNELSYFIKKLSWVEDACHLQEITNKTGNYRKKVEYNETLMKQLSLEKKSYPDYQTLVELFHSPRFNRLQLSLLQLLLNDKVINNKTVNEHLENDINAFAKASLEGSLQCLVDVMPLNTQLTSEQYLAQHKLFIRSLLTGSWFGDLYDKNERLAFRNPWLDIKQGISELETMLLLQRQIALLAEPSVKISAWLNSKIEHLMLTLEQSRQIALSTFPYWRS